jgi:poly [ADP-ribose] polymerase
LDTKQAVKVDLDSELVKICSQENEEQGIMPVDQYVSGASGYTVVKQDGKYLSCYLMWSDVKDNHNKFYIMQVLQHKASGANTLFTRYGRVGDRGV